MPIVNIVIQEEAAHFLIIFFQSLNTHARIVNGEKDQYGHKLKAQRNTFEEMQEKLVVFNQIFKDDEQDKWLEALSNLRKEFYANKQTIN